MADIKLDGGYFDSPFHYILARDHKTRGDGQTIVENGQSISRLAIVGCDILADGLTGNIF